jgi:DNA polymerase-3 subunit alpha
MAVSIHTHSDASAKDGVARIDNHIIPRLQQIGMPAAAITDHDVVANHIEFHDKMREADLHPVLGIEAYQTIYPRQVWQYKTLRDKESGYKADNFHLILLAQSDKGLRNLWALNTEAHRSGFWHNARVDWELLEEFSEGIVCSSSCFQSALSQSLLGNSFLPSPDQVVQQYRRIFGDRFFVEISTYPMEEQKILNGMLVDIAHQYGVGIVYANDAHYGFPEQYDLHEVILCVQYQEKRAQLEEPHHTPDLYIMDEADVRDHLSYLPQSVIDEAISNSEMIADMCKASPPGRANHVPVFIPDKKYKDSWDMFSDLVAQGYARRKPRFHRTRRSIWSASRRRWSSSTPGRTSTTTFLLYTTL